jgi:hypothetical protein
MNEAILEGMTPLMTVRAYEFLLRIFWVVSFNLMLTGHRDSLEWELDLEGVILSYSSKLLDVGWHGTCLLEKDCSGKVA